MFTNIRFPRIILPTRLDKNSSTLIDNIYYKLSPIFTNANSGIIFSRISDHFPYFLGLRLQVSSKEKPRSLHQWKKCFLNESDTNNAYSMFVHIYSSIYNQAFPKIRVKVKYYHRKHWLTEVMKNSIRQKNKLFKLSKKYSIIDSILKYKTYHSTLKNC